MSNRDQTAMPPAADAQPVGTTDALTPWDGDYCPPGGHKRHVGALTMSLLLTAWALGRPRRA